METRHDQPHPLPIALAPPARSGPLSWQEAREARAIRLALAFAAVIIHADGFTPEHSPLPWDYEGRWEWLRTHLAPLAPHAPTIAALCRILDPNAACRSWIDRRHLCAQIRRLARRQRRLVQLLASDTDPSPASPPLRTPPARPRLRSVPQSP